MKFRIQLVLAVLAGLVLGMAGIGAQMAMATDKSSFDTCKNLSGWYANPDEQDRKPTPTEDGLQFEGDDLIHHEVTGLNVADMKPGDFTLADGSPAPDQNSFFSVEVRNAEGTGYATLRWNTTSKKWEMTTGGQFYENESAADLVKMPPTPKGDRVFSFGVGYTKNPPGTKTVVVREVAFNGGTYSLTCKIEPSTPPSSASPSPTKTSTKPTVKPSTSHSSAAPGGVVGGDSSAGGPSLPVTGPALPIVIGVGLGLIVGGLALLAWRRKVRFEA